MPSARQLQPKFPIALMVNEAVKMGYPQCAGMICAYIGPGMGLFLFHAHLSRSPVPPPVFSHDSRELTASPAKPMVGILGKGVDMPTSKLLSQGHDILHVRHVRAASGTSTVPRPSGQPAKTASALLL